MFLKRIITNSLPKKPIQKLLFILINANSDVGCFNDAYILALIHYKLDFKIVNLYNTNLTMFQRFLGYFLLYTFSSLTFYYVDHDSFKNVRNTEHGIMFIDKTRNFLNFKKKKKKAMEVNYIIVLPDCETENSIFSMNAATNCKNKSVFNIVTFVSHKSQLSSDEKVRSHGLFTYYFCIFIREFQTSPPKLMVEKLNNSLARFHISFSYKTFLQR